MSKSCEDKRLYPRVKANFKLDTSENIKATSCDVSENGIRFDSTENITSPTISLRINSPDKNIDFKINARLIWRRNLSDGCYSYGMEFTNLDSPQKEKLRKTLIEAQIAELLNEISSPEIKKLVTDFFLGDLLNYITQMVEIIQRLSHEKAYVEAEESKLDQLNTQILLKGYSLSNLIPDKTITQKIKHHFRQLVGTWIYKSMIVRRALDKPRGYPGDYMMLEIVYNNKAISEGIGKYFDNNFLKSPYAVAVRIRKDHLRGMLREYINTSKLRKINIFNIACGSCREIKELMPNITTNTEILFNFLDWDEEALKFSQDSLLPISKKNVAFNFIKEDIMNLIKNDSLEKALGRQNLIYSIGLIDYLPDRILMKLIKSLFQFLHQGDQLILTHKDRDKTFPPLPPDWFCDWKFVPRSKDEIVKLFYRCGIPVFSLASESDDFDYIHYFTLIKG